MSIIEIVLISLVIIVLVSVFFIRRAKRQFQLRLRRIRSRIIYRSFDLEIPPTLSEEEVSLPYIGDITCNYNAHSPYIRCAVNPDGPCETCNHYQPKAPPSD